jgi:mRNA-degrading endonuclease RelE of RelBE toxin-antitoxin system
MVIIETSIFTKQVQKLLSDDDYRELQYALVQRPDMGQIIVGSGGLRKIRWRTHGRGKRGGVRIIYYGRFHPTSCLCSSLIQNLSRMI